MNYRLKLALGLAVLLSACSHSEKRESVSVADIAEPAAMMAPPQEKSVQFNAPAVKDTESATSEEAANQEEVTDKVPAPSAAAPTPVAAPRLLVYHADVRVKVTSLPSASARIDSLVRRSGGYTSASAETREDGQWRQEITIRVRPSRFGALLTTLTNLGTVEEKKLTTDDVTAEHADVAARLRTKRAVEQRYLALLNQAKKVSDMLEIEEKVGEVREEIESTESRLKTLNDEVAYSTITLICYQLLPVATPDAPVVSLGSRLVGALYDGWTLLTSLCIGAISIWPLLISGIVAVWAVRRWRRRRALA